MQNKKFVSWEEYERGGASDRDLLDPALYATLNDLPHEQGEAAPNVFRLYHPTTFPQHQDKNIEKTQPQFLQFKFIRRPPVSAQHEQCIPSQIGLKQFIRDQQLLKPV
jgi:hypothetical protein